MQLSVIAWFVFLGWNGEILSDEGAARKSSFQEWEKLDFDTIRVDGKINVGDSQVVFSMPPLIASRHYKLDLRFKNGFAYPLKFKGMTADCGCITGYVPVDVFDVGSEVRIGILFRAPGESEFNKNVALQLANGKNTYLNLEGMSEAFLSVVPKVLDVGPLQIGDKLEFTVTTKGALKDTPKLVSDFLENVDVSSIESPNGTGWHIEASVVKQPAVTNQLQINCLDEEDSQYYSVVRIVNSKELQIAPRFISKKKAKIRLIVVGAKEAIAAGRTGSWKLALPAKTERKTKNATLAVAKSNDRILSLTGDFKEDLSSGEELSLLLNGNEVARLKVVD